MPGQKERDVTLRIRRSVQALLLLSIFCFPAFIQAAQTGDIRRFCEGQVITPDSTLAGHKLIAPGEICEFYSSNRHQPVWQGSRLSGERLDQLLQAISSSGEHGFNPAHYHLNALSRPDLPPLARELLATDAFLAQARHRAIGVVEPKTLDPEWHLPRDTVNPPALLLSVVNGSQVATVLDNLWPQSQEYRALLERRAELLASRALESTLVPPGPLLKRGHSGPRVIALKERLLGPGTYSADYDELLLGAVRAFQYSAGLDDDGIVGPATLEVLNATHVSWLDRLDANLERWRWLPAVVPDTYLRVNIAAFQLRAIARGEDQLRMRVIVGRPYRHTPVFTETLKYLVYNPFWNVPYSIATRDKLPLLQRDAKALEDQGYEAKAAGTDVFTPVSAFDWAAVNTRNFDYLLRQRPGPANALGRIKFMLPNAFEVYLHDTPDHDLFQKQERNFSSGCIRLADAASLATWVLEGDGQAAEARALEQRLASGETRSIYLNKPLPVLILYLTAFTDDEGRVVFRRDTYQRDGAIVKALREMN